MRRPNATIGQAGTLSAAKIRMNSIDNARPSETAKCYELSADTCHHSATMAEGPSPDTSIIDKSSQKILANRAGWELCSVFRARIQFPSNVPLVCHSRTRNSLAKLTPLCACHTIRSCFHQDRGHKRKSRRPAASFLRETRAQSKHRAPALPFPVG